MPSVATDPAPNAISCAHGEPGHRQAIDLGAEPLEWCACPDVAHIAAPAATGPVQFRTCPAPASKLTS